MISNGSIEISRSVVYGPPGIKKSNKKPPKKYFNYNNISYIYIWRDHRKE